MSKLLPELFNAFTGEFVGEFALALELVLGLALELSSASKAALLAAFAGTQNPSNAIKRFRFSHNLTANAVWARKKK